MSWTPANIALSSIGCVHLAFMLGELFPPGCPVILGTVLKKWPTRLDLSHDQMRFVSKVVYNAGVYNGIVGVGLLMAASLGPSAFPVQVALLVGGVVAGLVGAATLTTGTIAQAVLGAIALVVVVGSH